MKNPDEEPTEEEFKEFVKEVLLKNLDRTLKPCSDYPDKDQLEQKFKIEKQS